MNENSVEFCVAPALRIWISAKLSMASSKAVAAEIGSSRSKGCSPVSTDFPGGIRREACEADVSSCDS